MSGERMHDPAQARPTLSVMQRQVRHMVRLIDDLLDVSRITLGKLELKRERVAVSSVIEAAIEAAWPAIQRAGHTFSSTLSPEALFLDGDQTRLAQVISNLLNNASKYTSNKGEIRLNVAREGEQVAISVSDTKRFEQCQPGVQAAANRQAGHPRPHGGRASPQLGQNGGTRRAELE